MSTIAFAAAVALDLLATTGLILLAARIYERAILRIGAPVKLQRLLAARSRQRHPADAGLKGTQIMRNADTNEADQSTATPRLSSGADLALRMVAVVLVIAGAVIGFGKPIAIVLVAVGLLPLILDQTLKHLPRKPAH